MRQTVLVPAMLFGALLAVSSASAQGSRAMKPSPSAAVQPGATGSAAAFDTSTVSVAMINAGRSLFHGRGTCLACHGPDLKGSAVAPPLVPHAWRDARNGDFRAIFDVVTHGVPSTLMVSHPGGISDADARNLAAYVWSVNHRGVKP